MKLVLTSFIYLKYLLLILIIVNAQHVINAQEKVLYISYGRQSPATSGDDNYKQAFFIKIPESAPEYFYVRLFDADCYGAIDDEVVVYNTETIFSLYGISDILPDKNSLKGRIDLIENKTGKLIFKKLYSSDFDIDNKWITFTEVDKRRGQFSDGYYYFKLIVEGGYGTDGNIYDVFISKSPDSNQDLEGAEFYTYAPTLRNDKLNSYAQIKFKDNYGGKYVQHNFDMDGAALNYDTPFRSNQFLNSSGDGEWRSSNIDLMEIEKGNMIGINFGRFKEIKNDVSIYVTDAEAKLIPIPLPIYYKRQNTKPIPAKRIISSDQWNIKTFDASESRDPDRDRMEYLWYFGDGSNAGGVTVSHKYEKSGDYKCVLYVSDNSGNIDNTSMLNFTVKVNQPPVADAGKDIVASSSEVSFDASASTDPDGKLINYIWDFGDGSKGSGIYTKHIYANPGSYKVTLQVSDDSQLANDKNTSTINVTINKKPIADAGPDIITEPGKEISFSGINSIDPDGSITSYIWDFGDGTSAEGMEVNHTFINPGKYSVLLSVKDNTDDQKAIDIDETIASVNSPPYAVGGPDIIAAPNQEVEFNALKSFDADGGKLIYYWEFSDGIGKSDKPIVKRSFSNPGLYKAFLTVSDNSGALNNTSTDEVSIRINNQPTAIIGGDIFTCSSVAILDASGSYDPDGDLLKYSWDFGDGSPTVNGISVSHEYKSKGLFPVVLTVDDGNGLSNSTNSISISIVINNSPVADAGEDIVICAGEFVPFDGGKSYDPENGLLKYFWDFGDGTTAEGINPVKSYNTGGVYQIKLTVTDDSGLGCNKDIDTKLITVIESPIANAGEDMQVCAFEEVRFDGTKSTDADGVVNSYTWDFGDGSTGGGAAPKHTYKKAGIYKVVLSITGETQGDCDNSSADELTVVVSEAPEAKFSIASSAPVNTDVKLDASESNGKSDNITLYEWDFGDSTIGTGRTINHKYEKPGLYFVTLKVITDSKSDCNSSSIVNSILINEAPVAIAEGISKTKLNTSVIFSALKSYDADGAVTSYKWDFGDGSTSEGVYTEHIYNKPGNYKVSLEVKDNTHLINNSARDEVLIEVYEDFNISIDSKDIDCPGNEINFIAKVKPDAPDSAVTYKWQISDGTVLYGKTISHVFMKPGNYNVTVIAESDLFSGKETKIFSKNIKINSTPVIDVNKTIYACPGEEINLDASKTYDADNDKLNFSWEIGNSKKSGSKVIHSFGKSGSYKARLKVEDNSNTSCGSAEEEIDIIIYSPPAAVTQEYVEGFTGGAYDAILFDASKSTDPDGDALTFEWEFGDGEKGFGSKVFHYYRKSGNYIAVLKISDGKINNCSTTIQKINVTVKKH